MSDHDLRRAALQFAREAAGLSDEDLAHVLDSLLRVVRDRAFSAAEAAEKAGDERAEAEATLVWAWTLRDERRDALVRDAWRDALVRNAWVMDLESDFERLVLLGLRAWRDG